MSLTTFLRRLEPEYLRGFPWSQAAVVMLMRFAEPIAFTSLFPYVYFMVQSFGIPSDDIPKYTGYISGSFAFAQTLTSLLWGSLSDRYGRKPILLLGLVGTALSMICFGMAQSVTSAIFFRSLAGLLNGNVSVVRTMIGELATERAHQPTAFSIMPTMFAFGTIFGPMVGGLLSQPVTNHPTWFTEGSTLYVLFTNYPFLLPNIVVAAGLSFAFMICLLFLDETHDDYKHRTDYGRRVGKAFWRMFGFEYESEKSAVTDATSPLLDNRNSDEETLFDGNGSSAASIDDTAAKTQVFTDTIKKCLSITAVLALHSCVYEEFLPVLFASKVEIADPWEPFRWPFHLRGGMGLNSSEIGTLLSSTGIFGITVVTLLYPAMDKRWGSLPAIRIAATSYPFMYAIIAYVFIELTFVKSKMFYMVIFMIGRTFLNSLSFSPLTVTINRNISNPRHRGTINAVQTTVSACSRSLAPFIWGELMSVAAATGYMMLPFWMLIPPTVFGAVVAWKIRE